VRPPEAAPAGRNQTIVTIPLQSVSFRSGAVPSPEMVSVLGEGVAKVDGEIVCEAEMSAMVRDR